MVKSKFKASFDNGKVSKQKETYSNTVDSETNSQDSHNSKEVDYASHDASDCYVVRVVKVGSCSNQAIDLGREYR